MLSIDTSNLCPLFFGLRGHVWEKPHTIAQRPQQTCINKNITQILTQISTSLHNNELTPIGFVPKSILAPPEHVIGQICSSSSAPSSCITLKLDFIFCFSSGHSKICLHFIFCLLTYLLTMYLLTYLLTYLLFTYSFTYLPRSVYFLFYLLTYLLTYLITYVSTYLFIICLFIMYLFIYWFPNVFPYCTTLALKQRVLHNLWPHFNCFERRPESYKQVRAGKTRECICVQEVPSISNTRASHM